MTEPATAFVKTLVDRFPDLKPVLEEHLRDQNGELLSHLFFGDVTRHVVALIRDGSSTAQEQAQQIIDFLEASYSSAAPNVQNLIMVSFLENLQQEGEATEKAEKMLGPQLTAALRELAEHWEEIYRNRERKIEAEKTQMGFIKSDKNSVPCKTEANHRCPCCKCKTLVGRGGFECCPVCYWEDDGQDENDAEQVRGGPNGELSLRQAQSNFRQFGASDPSLVKYVRKPLPEEL